MGKMTPRGPKSGKGYAAGGLIGSSEMPTVPPIDKESKGVFRPKGFRQPKPPRLPSVAGDTHPQPSKFSMTSAFKVPKL